VKWDLLRPCAACPFNRGSSTRITFRNRDRAEEIEELAYREGFVCHEHAELVETVDYEGDVEEHYADRKDGSGQHCAGALIMYLRSHGGNIPFEWLDEDEQDRIENRLDPQADVFDDETEFVCAQDDRRLHMRGQFRRKSTA
jgi:hypothetical protein